MRMQDEDVDARRGRGRPRCAAEPVSPEVAPTMVTRCAALRQHMVEQRPEQLQRQSLKASVGPWNSSSSQMPAVELLQRRHRRVAEAAIGLAPMRAKVVLVDAPADERPHDAGGELGIVEPDQRASSPRGQRGQLLRHIEAAVAGEAGEQHVVEGKRRGGAPSADVAQGEQTPNAGYRMARRLPYWPHPGGARAGLGVK